MSDPAYTEPVTLRAGDSVTWRTALPEHLPADGWSLAYRLLWAGGYADCVVDVEGDEYIVSLSASQTAGVPAGKARLFGWVERSADRLTVHDSVLPVLANLAVATTYDSRTQAQKALEDARAALAAYTADGGSTVESYTIAGRSMKFRSAADLITLINTLERDVARERIAGAVLAGGAPGRIVTRSQ